MSRVMIPVTFIQYILKLMKTEIFCITCGKLEIVQNQVQHPALDKIYAKMLENSFTTNLFYE